MLAAHEANKTASVDKEKGGSLPPSLVL